MKQKTSSSYRRVAGFSLAFGVMASPVALADDINSGGITTKGVAIEQVTTERDRSSGERDQGKALTLKAFRMDIARAMKDSDVATKLAGELSKAGGTSGTPTPGADPSTLLAVIDGKLDLIRTAIEKKDYAAARKSLDESK